MGSQFKIAETVTAEDWEAYSACWLAHKAGGAGRFMNSLTRAAPAAGRAANTFLGVLLIGMGFIMLSSLLVFRGETGMYSVYPLILFLCASFLFFGVRTFRKRKSSVTSVADILASSGIADTPMEFSFEDDAFFVREGGSSSSYRYHTLSDVWEDANRYYLFISDKMQFILQKVAFSCGSPDDFSAFLEQKTGKPVEYVK